MLSAAYHEPPTPPAVEPVPSTATLRRIAVTFAPDRSAAAARRERREPPPMASPPRFSRIVFRAGSVSRL